MSNWIPDLRENIKLEFGDKPAVATLATVASDHVPEARSVVIRDLLKDGGVLISSDARSDKNRQLKINPAATLVLWLPTIKKQYRIKGRVHILEPDESLRLRVWKASSDSARALFAWPPAGEARQAGDESAFAKSVAADQPMPECFEVLQFSPIEADVLDLNLHPHLRTRWTLRGNQWSGLTVNP